MRRVPLALPLGWHGAYRHFRHPLDYLGADGGGGVGAGPGITVGAALALKGSGAHGGRHHRRRRFPDGQHRAVDRGALQAALPVLIANNRSFYNDEMHQERVAKARGRPVENKWIGQRIDEPDIDLAMMARAQGAIGIGPIKNLTDLKPAMQEAIGKVKAGAVCVVDIRVLPGYDSNMNPTPPAASRR